MDPIIWGPLIWDLLSDVSYRYDLLAQQGLIKKETRKRLMLWIQSLCSILPCPKCRVAYCKWLQTTPCKQNIEEGRLLYWVWSLHHHVNEELQRPISLTFEMYLDRLQTRSILLSVEGLFDALFLIASDYDSDARSKWFRIFFLLLPIVLSWCPNRENIVVIFQKDQIQSKDLKSRDNLYNYIYQCQKSIYHQLSWKLKPLSMLLEQYLH